MSGKEDSYPCAPRPPPGDTPTSAAGVRRLNSFGRMGSGQLASSSTTGGGGKLSPVSPSSRNTSPQHSGPRSPTRKRMVTLSEGSEGSSGNFGSVSNLAGGRQTSLLTKSSGGGGGNSTSSSSTVSPSSGGHGLPPVGSGFIVLPNITNLDAQVVDSDTDSDTEDSGKLHLLGKLPPAPSKSSRNGSTKSSRNGSTKSSRNGSTKTSRSASSSDLKRKTSSRTFQSYQASREDSKAYEERGSHSHIGPRQTQSHGNLSRSVNTKRGIDPLSINGPSSTKRRASLGSGIVVRVEDGDDLRPSTSTASTRAKRTSSHIVVSSSTPNEKRGHLRTRSHHLDDNISSGSSRVVKRLSEAAQIDANEREVDAKVREAMKNDPKMREVEARQRRLLEEKRKLQSKDSDGNWIDWVERNKTEPLAQAPTAGGGSGMQISRTFSGVRSRKGSQHDACGSGSNSCESTSLTPPTGSIEPPGHFFAVARGKLASGGSSPSSQGFTAHPPLDGTASSLGGTVSSLAGTLNSLGGSQSSIHSRQLEEMQKREQMIQERARDRDPETIRAKRWAEAIILAVAFTTFMERGRAQQQHDSEVCHAKTVLQMRFLPMWRLYRFRLKAQAEGVIAGLLCRKAASRRIKNRNAAADTIVHFLHSKHQFFSFVVRWYVCTVKRAQRVIRRHLNKRKCQVDLNVLRCRKYEKESYWVDARTRRDRIEAKAKQAVRDGQGQIEFCTPDWNAPFQQWRDIKAGEEAKVAAAAAAQVSGKAASKANIANNTHVAPPADEDGGMVREVPEMILRRRVRTQLVNKFRDRAKMEAGGYGAGGKLLRRSNSLRGARNRLTSDPSPGPRGGFGSSQTSPLPEGGVSGPIIGFAHPPGGGPDSSFITHSMANSSLDFGSASTAQPGATTSNPRLTVLAVQQGLSASGSFRMPGTINGRSPLIAATNSAAWLGGVSRDSSFRSDHTSNLWGSIFDATECKLVLDQAARTTGSMRDDATWGAHLLKIEHLTKPTPK